MQRILVAGAILAVLCATCWGASNQATTLSFKDRVVYQERIERIYYEHRTGEKPPFEEAVPRDVLEAKVKKYLAQNAITDINDAALQRELERICQSTKAPDTHWRRARRRKTG